MQLDLSAEEGELLVNILEASHQDIRSEIHDTKTPSYKDQLKAREAVLERLESKLRALLAVSSHPPTRR